MNIYSFASIFASLVCISLSVFVYTRSRKDFIKILFSIGTLYIGLWTSFPFITSIAVNDLQALYFTRLIYIFAVFVPSLFLHFMLIFVNAQLNIIRRRIVILAYIVSFIFLLNIFNPQFIHGVRRFSPHFAIIPGPIYIYFFFAFTLMGVYSFSHFFRAYLTSVGYRKNQLRYIFIAIFFAFSGGIMHFLSAYFNWEPFPHDFLVMFYPVLMTYAIVKHRIMELKVVLTRTGIFVVVYTFVLGIPLLLVSFGRHYLISLFSDNWWFIPFIILTVLATFGPFLFIYFQKKAERILLREQYLYQTTLKNAANELARIHNLKKLLNLIVHMVNRTVRITHSALYFYDDVVGKFLLKARRGEYRYVEAIDPNDILIRWMKKNRETILLEDIVRLYQDNHTNDLLLLIEKLNLLDAELVVPGFLKDKLLGFLLLGKKRSGGIYTSEDINTFSLLAHQTVLALENARLYEEMENEIEKRTKELVQVQKQLIQAEKLATVGTLAGGVAHEINNPLAAILTNVQMLLYSLDDFDEEFWRESLQIIEEATKRCRDIVQKLMFYARKPKDKDDFSLVEMKDIVNRVVSLLAYQFKQDNVRIIFQCSSEESYTVKGNQNELEQVLTNIVLNARDAIKKIKKEGEIVISLQKDTRNIVLTIEDNGCGIAPDIVSKIFDPFFTTKDVGKGLGMGLSICQAIIEKHHGDIKVASELNKGTRFSIVLPVVEGS